ARLPARAPTRCAARRASGAGGAWGGGRGTGGVLSRQAWKHFAAAGALSLAAALMLARTL
ncbi:hypothetical protein ACLEQD_20965, partial [Corallococcus sp. 4LFB]